MVSYDKETLIKKSIAYLGGLVATYTLLLALLHGYFRLSWTSYWILWDATGTMMPIGYETVEVKDRGFEDLVLERTLKFSRWEYGSLVRRVKETELYQIDTATADELQAVRQNEVPGYWTATEHGQKFVDSTRIGGVGPDTLRIRVRLVDSTRTLYFKRSSYQ